MSHNNVSTMNMQRTAMNSTAQQKMPTAAKSNASCNIKMTIPQQSKQTTASIFSIKPNAASSQQKNVMMTNANVPSSRISEMVSISELPAKKMQTDNVQQIGRPQQKINVKNNTAFNSMRMN